MSQELKMRLLQSLTEFGLNPWEWTLKPLANMGFRLIHRYDPEFRLRGAVRGEHWLHLAIDI